MTNKQMPEALRLAIEFEECIEINAIPSINDVEKAAAELRRQHAEIERLRSVAFDWNHALIGAITQLRMAGDCIESGRNDEALLHTRSLPREKREAIEHYAAMQSTKEKQ